MLLAAGALGAGQLAAATLLATLALSVFERLIRRWKASTAPVRRIAAAPLQAPTAMAAAAAAAPGGRQAAVAALGLPKQPRFCCLACSPQVPDTRRQQFELQQEVAHLQRQAAALNHPDTFAQAGRRCLSEATPLCSMWH